MGELGGSLEQNLELQTLEQILLNLRNRIEPSHFMEERLDSREDKGLADPRLYSIQPRA